MFDDASNTAAPVASARRPITESKRDMILGSTTTPNTLAMLDMVSENQTPIISLAASSKVAGR